VTTARLTPEFLSPGPPSDGSVPLGPEGDPVAHAVGPAVTGARPVWLLDVDGVLNANKPGWGAPPLARTAYAHQVAYRMRFAPALILRIRTLHAAGRVEVRWATTWVDHIDQITTIMHLSTWPAFTLTQPNCDAYAAKYTAALHVVETERRPLIWTDDEVIPDDHDPACRRLREAGPPVLLIRSRPNRGLQPDHLDQIEAFTASCGDSARLRSDSARGG
jgi:hypothetical protein